MEVFRRIRSIEAPDLDDLAHVNNVVWIRFMVEVAVAHSCAVGLDKSAYEKVGGVWVVSRHEVDYLRPASLGERILEETWVSALRGPLCTRRYRFRRDGDGELLVQASTQWAFVDTRTHRPRRVPPAVAERFVVTVIPEA